MWKRGYGQWYISGEEGGVELPAPVFPGVFLRYPMTWGVSMALGNLFRPPVTRWSGRLVSGSTDQSGQSEVIPNPEPQPERGFGKEGDDV